MVPVCLSAWCLPGVATHVIKCERPTARRGGHSTMLRVSPSAWMKAGCSRCLTSRGRAAAPVGSLMSARWLETSTLLLARASSHTMFMVRVCVRMYVCSAVCVSVLRTCVYVPMMHVTGMTLYVIVRWWYLRIWVLRLYVRMYNVFVCTACGMFWWLCIVPYIKLHFHSLPGIQWIAQYLLVTLCHKGSWIGKCYSMCDLCEFPVWCNLPGVALWLCKIPLYCILCSSFSWSMGQNILWQSPYIRRFAECMQLLGSYVPLLSSLMEISLHSLIGMNFLILSLNPIIFECWQLFIIYVRTYLPLTLLLPFLRLARCCTGCTYVSRHLLYPTT